METNARDRVAHLNFWSSSHVEPEPLKGGITNNNFIVYDQGEHFVVRLGDDIPVHGVMRFNELSAARAAYTAGLSPEIVHSTDGVIIMRFIKGCTFTEQEVQEQKNLERIMPLIKTCHNEIPKHFQGPALVFWPFHVCRNYIRTAREDNSRVSHLLQRFLDILEELEKTIDKIKLVFCHNDLLAANFIDDGNRLWLIDWDYAGYNTALFDLANLSSNNELSAKQEDWMLEAYYEQAVTDELRCRLTAMKCISLLRETLWSIASEVHSVLDFDYIKYTDKNLDRFEFAYETFRQMD